MAERIPLIQPGDRITAARQNAMAMAINEELLHAPRDVEGGVEEGVQLAGATTWQETSRTSETVRVTNPEDEEQYVDVERPLTVEFVNGATGETMTLVFASSEG